MLLSLFRSWANAIVIWSPRTTGYARSWRPSGRSIRAWSGSRERASITIAYAVFIVAIEPYACALFFARNVAPEEAERLR